MKKLEEITIPNDRQYTDEHIWLQKDGDSFLVGITDFAQDQLGEIVYIELPDSNDEFDIAQEFGTIESVKSVNKLFMPIAGKVIEINEILEDTPTLINVDSYKNWIIRISTPSSDFTNLLSDEAYRTLLSK